MPDRDASKLPIFWICAGLALTLHVILLLNADGLQGGMDLRPHLRLIQQMGEEPGLRTVYAPFYHVTGALLSPLVGLERFPAASRCSSVRGSPLGSWAPAPCGPWVRPSW